MKAGETNHEILVALRPKGEYQEFPSPKVLQTILWVQLHLAYTGIFLENILYGL